MPLMLLPVLTSTTPFILPRLPLISPKLLHILKRVFGVRKPIPLFDNFRIQESQIQEINVSKDTALSPLVWSYSSLTSFPSTIPLVN